MSAPWSAEERAEVEAGVRLHPVQSGRCAVLARVVLAVGQRRDKTASGKQIRPRGAARYVLPNHPSKPIWASHTYVEAHRHAVDAITGADGCEAEHYLDRHWQHPGYLEIINVDVSKIDPGIEDEL